MKSCEKQVQCYLKLWEEQIHTSDIVNNYKTVIWSDCNWCRDTFKLTSLGATPSIFMVVQPNHLSICTTSWAGFAAWTPTAMLLAVPILSIL